MIRSLLPTDLVLFFRGKPLHNQAKTKENLGKRETPFSLAITFLKPWIIPQEKRSTWVWRDKTGLNGLVSARSSAHSRAWQIDYLLLQGDDEEICFDLLNEISAAGGGAGIQRIFLRLPAESPLIEAARDAGFHLYTTERLYQRGQEKGNRGNPEVCLSFSPRPKTSEDEYRLYELYTAAVPPQIRQIEGMTFSEWKENKDRDIGRVPRRELVCEKEGMLAAWIQLRTIQRSMGQFEVIVRPEQEEWLENLVEYSLACLRGCTLLLCLISEFQQRLGMVLQDYGFEEAERYHLSVKELGVKAPQPCPLLLRA